MIGIIVIIILTLSSLSGVAYLLLSLQDTWDTNNAISFNDRRGIEAKEAIIDSITTIDDTGSFYIPAGEISENGWTIIPDWVYPTAYSSSGIPFSYCPFANNVIAGGSDNVILPNGNGYGISKSNDYNGRGYVTSSGYKKDNLLGVIVSPIGKNTDMPNCYDVTFKNGKYIIPNGQTWVITDREVDIASKSPELNSQEVTTYVTPEYSNDGGLEDGTGFGGQSLVVNINRFKDPYSNIQKMYLYLGSGNYIIEDNDLFISNNNDIDLKRRELILVGDIDNPPHIYAEDGSTLDFNIPNVYIELRNIDLDAEIIPNGNIYALENMSIEGLESSKSNIYMQNSNTQNNEIDSISLNNSNIDFYGTNTIIGGILSKSSTIKLDKTTLNSNSTNSNALIQLLSSSKMTINNSSLNIENGSASNNGIYNSGSTLDINNSIYNAVGSYTYLINNSGDLNIDNNSELKLNGNSTYGIYANKGSIQRINQSYIYYKTITTNSPTTTIYDTGDSSVITGDNSSFSAETECWNTTTNSSSFQSSSSLSSKRTVKDSNTLANTSNWICD